jgi:GLPGLI family protein
MKNVFMPILLFILSISAAFSQVHPGLKSGKITFEIAYTDDKMDEDMKAFLPTESTLYFKGDRSRMETGMAMGKSITITDQSRKKSVVLMDFMGNKIAIESDLSKDSSQVKRDLNLHVEHLDGEKAIAGYNCKKARVTQKQEGKEYAFDVWYTDEIGSHNGLAYGLEEIKGCMLEFEIVQNAMQMRMTTKSIEKIDVNDDMFEIPQGYTLKSIDEMKSMMGGGR